ncbi:DNA-processing protein DprA [Candidatus Margulisiibacteriota bacterium]
MNPKLKYWLALNNLPKTGPVKIKKLLEKYKTSEAACLAEKCSFDWAEQEIERAENKKIKIFCPEDEEYPENLKNIYDPPVALYVRGKLLKQDKKSLAIVGTRRATQSGLEVAGKFAYDLSNLGITIISGLAMGIDAAAHFNAKRTIAVFGSGVDQVYPKVNSKLAEKILDEGGALISEFPLGMLPEKWTFPQRNRIISGLSLGVIVVEGAEDSGALITARLALEQGREVFAVPGSIQSAVAKGPNSLIKQGAKLIQSIDDILEELEPVLGIKSIVRKLSLTFRNIRTQNRKY